MELGTVINDCCFNLPICAYNFHWQLFQNSLTSQNLFHSIRVGIPCVLITE